MSLHERIGKMVTIEARPDYFCNGCGDRVNKCDNCGADLLQDFSFSSEVFCFGDITCGTPDYHFCNKECKNEWLKKQEEK